MSGHSKWSTIKHKKGKSDAKRGQLFSKLSKAITVAAKEGGTDPGGNATLATAIQKAKDNSMPKDNIERAIERGAGLAGGEAFESLTYEGYGPAGVAVIVEALTDNKNRTAADIRHIFNKGGGSLGTSGCVAWLFTRRGVIHVEETKTSEESLMECALEAGAQDVLLIEGLYEVLTDPADFMAVREALQSADIPILSAEITLQPQTTVALEEADAKKTLRLIEMLDENDDVQEVHSNAEIRSEVYEAVAG